MEKTDRRTMLNFKPNIPHNVFDTKKDTNWYLINAMGMFQVSKEHYYKKKYG